MKKSTSNAQKSTSAKATTTKKVASKTTEKEVAKPTGKSDKQSAAAKVETKEVLKGFGGKKRGRFAHPEGIKEGDAVTFKVKTKDGKWRSTKGTLKYCNRNSVEYAVIESGKQLFERSLKSFTKA